MRTCDIIRNLRESRHMSQMEMARRSGISQATISAIELGARQPSMEMLERLAVFFGVPKSSLVGQEELTESVKVLAEAIQSDEALLKLFEYARYMSKEDVQAMLSVAQVISAKAR